MNTPALSNTKNGRPGWPFAPLIFFLVLGLAGCGADAGEGDEPGSKGLAPANPSTPPNIILILADDLGYGDLSCYGQTAFATPHLDRLAAEGIRFTSFYAGSTVCAPSRASLMTGKHGGHTSVRGNSPAPQILTDEEVTLAEVLRPAGYRSGIVGKWGVGTTGDPADPARNGFDYFYGYADMGHAHNFYPTFLYRDTMKIPQTGNVARTDIDWSTHYSRRQPAGGGVAADKVTYAVSEFENETINFIERNRDQPFFLYLSLNTPHANNEAGQYEGNGMEVRTELVEGERIFQYGEFADRDWPAPEKGFATMIRDLDNLVGRIREELVAEGLADNTVILFTSDNGPHAEGKHTVEYFDSNGPLRGNKRDLYEGGVRVPCIAYDPRSTVSGITVDQPFAFWDLLPTFADYAGRSTPPGLDGKSLYPLLREGQTDLPGHDLIYHEFYEQGGKQSLRRGDWKLVRRNLSNDQPVVEELYHLGTDLGETRDLSGDPAQAARLEELRVLAAGEHTAYGGMVLEGE